MDSKIYKLKDINISYIDTGKSGMPIIFIHGFPFDKSSWEPQIEYLNKYCRVIAMDLRGFGKSDIGVQEFSVDLFADDIIQLMDGLNIPKAIICGLSMGGYIALNIVERYGDRVESLILSDTQCNADSQEGKDKRYSTIKDLQNGGHTNFANGFINNVFTSRTINEKKPIVDKVKNIILSCSIDSIIGALKALASRRETCSILNKIKIPVLVMCGNEDKLTPPEKSIYLHQHITNSKIKLINNAAHVSNLEQADIFNNEIREFLS
ncbi:MAG TPA: alpha/beta fold hydrolase [Saprospiraceae bacterium]|nr:alpha/beta fold hydrolase [Saprospiraceae bacterium]